MFARATTPKKIHGKWNMPSVNPIRSPEKE